MNYQPDFDEVFATLNVLDQVLDSPKLEKWARAYAKVGHASSPLTGTSDEDLCWWPAATTLALICTLWPYCEWPDWLSWQQCRAPRDRGPWWVATFSSPSEWCDATMYLRDPWDYPFSHLFMANHSGPIEFDLHTRRSIRLPKKQQDWLAGAVLDGILEDYDETEFILACSRKPRSLQARVWYPNELSDNAYLKPKKDRHGIYWFVEK